MKKQIIKVLKPIVEHIPKVALMYRYMRDSWQIMENPKETPMGFKLIGNYAMQQGEFETDETEIIKKIIPQIDVFINVGANIGYYCCIALSFGKKVVAFEPINLNLQYLLKNIKANRWEDNIEIFPLALSNNTGIIEIYGGGNGASLIKGWADTSEQYVTLVPTLTMDSVLAQRFQGKKCFILIDIEGAEKQMLEGASSLICSELKPIWMVEISIKEHQPKGVSINPNLFSTFQIFWDNGYEAWTADKQCRLIHPDEIISIIRRGKESFFTHNFLFIKEGEKCEVLGD